MTLRRSYRVVHFAAASTCVFALARIECGRREVRKMGKKRRRGHGRGEGGERVVVKNRWKSKKCRVFVTQRGKAPRPPPPPPPPYAPIRPTEKFLLAYVLLETGMFMAAIKHSAHAKTSRKQSLHFC